MPGLQGDEPEAGRDGTRTERPGDFRDLQGGYSTCQGLAGNLTVTGRWESQVSLVASGLARALQGDWRGGAQKLESLTALGRLRDL